ncbi:MAG: hypothetical protein U9Q12_00935 [Patescibacteria group bacterium]|nr:hypothetical protein [Patescibacteria group bacterium]
MASGLGFESTTDVKHKGAPRKKTVSRGLIVAFVLLLLVLLVFGGLKMYEKKLDAQKDGITAQITEQRTRLANALTPETADFIVRARVLEDELYRGYESNDILGEIEDIMILKESDQSGNRVVLKSFQYNAGAHTTKKFDAGNATITGAGSVTITADADTFDVMAQQIDAFKKSEYFDNVQVGTTDRDDFGRIIFTLTMDVVGYEKSPYEKKDNDAASVEEVVVDTVEEVDVVPQEQQVEVVDVPEEEVEIVVE